MWDGDLTGEMVDDRYALGDLYGSGGMAEVYRAVDTRLDRRVAIKLFLGTATPEDQIRLDREAQMLAALRCPGVVTVYDTGSHRGRPYYVMQPIDGGTLRKRMREALAPEVVARIGADVAGILAHVHKHGVVHRDVKPSNILLDPTERRVYLADFGLALQAQVTRVTRSGILVGTAGYLAPEQVRGAEVTPAADVYALALVLLECLTGRPEYPGGDTEAALARLHREPRIPANLPPAWIEALAAMTGSDPVKRPSATEAAALLTAAERASSGASPLVEVREVAQRPEPEPLRRRNNRILLAGGALGAAAVTLLIVVGLLNNQVDPRQSTDGGNTPTTAEQAVDKPRADNNPAGTQSPSTVTVVERAPGGSTGAEDESAVGATTTTTTVVVEEEVEPVPPKNEEQAQPTTTTTRKVPSTPEPPTPSNPGPRTGKVPTERG